MAVEGDKKTVLRPGNEKLRILIASNTVQKMCEIFTERRKEQTTASVSLVHLRLYVCRIPCATLP